MVARPTHLVEIVCREPTHLGFYDASDIGAGGVWLNPSGSGTSLMWRHPWPTDIIKALISDRNLEGTVKTPDLELSALVLQEATLPEMCLEATMTAPRSGSDNMPTI